MPKVKVGIVEDEVIIALGISEALQELGYDVTTPATNYTEALQMITAERPDILLLDIHLGGSKDGIDLAEKVNTDFGLPFIFLTANSDLATVERAKSVAPQAYLVKPYRKDELFTSIELCLHNFARRNSAGKEVRTESAPLLRDSIFIKQGSYFHKVALSDIFYLESDNNYVHVHTTKGDMLVRSTIQDYLDLIGSDDFYRVHRSFAVNIHQVQSINNEYLIVNQAQIPLSRTYRDQLLSGLKLG